MTTDPPLTQWPALVAMLEHNASLFGGQPALVADDNTALSHRQLAEQARAVVQSLNRLGAGRGDNVAMVLPPGPETAMAFLGVASGATAAPLNPAYTEKEFHFYLEDLQARALILPPGSDSPARAAAASLGVPVIELISDRNHPGLFELSAAPRPLNSPGGFAGAEDVALVLHTSGTTSRPKIVPLTHANLLASGRHMVHTLQLRPHDRCLNTMPLFHIHGLVAGILASLCSGGATVCTGAFDAEKFFHWLERCRPTWHTAGPTMHLAVLGRAQGFSAPPRHTLRLIRSSSAALPIQVIEGLEAVFKIPVIESYGMTEAAHPIASNPLPPRARKAGSVGLPAGPEIAILDEAGNVLPSGQIGEVSIRGPNVTRGYVNNPKANATAWSNGWFRTGDQGYLDGDGYLFLTGRLKELINRGGEKIAPREIDEALLAHPAVRQAVAFAMPHSTLGEDVAAAVVLKTGQSVGEAVLREFVFARLPAFKVPSRIVFLNDLPKGATGKVQRIGFAGRVADALVITYEAPRTEIERLIAATFAEILKCPDVGRNDNFFVRGGDSLRATQVLARLGPALELQIPVGELFRYPTPALFAHRLEIMRQSQIDALAAELEKLSPEEQDRLLAGLPKAA